MQRVISAVCNLPDYLDVRPDVFRALRAAYVTPGTVKPLAVTPELTIRHEFDVDMDHAAETKFLTKQGVSRMA